MEYRIIEMETKKTDTLTVNFFYPQVKIEKYQEKTTGMLWWKKTVYTILDEWKFFVKFNNSMGFFYVSKGELESAYYNSISDCIPVGGKTKEEAEKIIKQDEKEREMSFIKEYEKNAYKKDDFKIHELNSKG